MKYCLINIFLFVILANSCNEPGRRMEDKSIDTLNSVDSVQNFIFNEDSAYNHVSAQVGFGPRVPGSKEHLRCYDYLVRILRPLADTLYLQNSNALTFDKKNIPVKNIIAEFNPLAVKRIILCAHWDTRPFADQDKTSRDQPIPGANDGASGVGILLEIASVIKKNNIKAGIDIILFDAEDWGDNTGNVENSYCLGSQYWGKNLHKPGYKADFGILLDMVGAPNALFGFEEYSVSTASDFVNLIWETAGNSGYGNYFKNFNRGGIIDDHYYMNNLTKIPVIDIIDFDPSTPSHFGKYWHTHADNMTAIDKKTLKAVGQTLLNVISNY